MIDLTQLLKVNAELLSELDKRAELVDAREQKARHVLADCESERREIDAERATLDAADRLYRRKYLPETPAGDDGGSEPATREMFPGEPLKEQQRARIGEQRYRMMANLRLLGRFVPLADLASATGLSTRRVRDQVRADVADGFMEERDGSCRLSLSGEKLMARYEEYQRSKNEPLPSLDDNTANDEGDVFSAVEDDEI